MRITSGNATIGPVTLNGGTMGSYGPPTPAPNTGRLTSPADITVGGAATSTIQSEMGRLTV